MMQRLIYFNLLLINIGIAVVAGMPARIVFANIDTGNATAKLSLILIFFNIQIPAA
jgi:hypothetical protein